jgi:hypothetical protein
MKFLLEEEMWVETLASQTKNGCHKMYTFIRPCDFSKYVSLFSENVKGGTQFNAWHNSPFTPPKKRPVSNGHSFYWNLFLRNCNTSPASVTFPQSPGDTVYKTRTFSGQVLVKLNVVGELLHLNRLFPHGVKASQALSYEVEGDQVQRNWTGALTW